MEATGLRVTGLNSKDEHMKQEITIAAKEYKCKHCHEVIEQNLPYIGNTYMTKTSKFYVKKYHVECFINITRTAAYTKYLNRRGYGDNKGKRGGLQIPRKKLVGSDDDLLRRRTLMQYLNRDRWKLEGYYEHANIPEIARSYVKIAKRIDELGEIGIDYKLGQLAELIRENDAKLLQKLAGETSSEGRARQLRLYAEILVG